MVEHYRSLDELIAAAPASGRLGGVHATRGMRTFAYVDVLDETWRVCWETDAEDLVKLRDDIAGGGDPVRFTGSGVRALGIGAKADGIYIYEVDVVRRDVRKHSASKSEGTCCWFIAPVGSECAICGNIVGPRDDES
jgi:hypothetical protein